MKRLISLFIGMTFFISSCTQDDQVFDLSSTERVAVGIKEYKELLTSSEYGWKMQYFPDASRLGGYNFFFDFREDGHVKMAADFREGIQESTFSFSAGQGIILNFETYNYLHILADPGYFPAGTGYRGDFELIIQRATEDSLVCFGRKWKQPMVLTRASASDWNSLDKIYENEKILAPFAENVPFFRNVRVNGAGVATFLYTPTNRFIEYFYKDKASGKMKSGETGVIFTTTGFTLKKDIDVNGVLLHDFTYDEGSGFFTFGTNGTLTMEHESVIEFDNAWDQLYQTDGGSLYTTSQDFRNLFNEAKELEPELATLQFYWNVKSYRLFSFVFLKEETGDTYKPRWYHSLIENIQSPGEDCAIFEPAMNSQTGEKVIISDRGSDEELNRLFFDEGLSSKKFNAILDFIFNPKGFTIIPTSDGKFYMISKSRSNYWLLLKTS